MRGKRYEMTPTITFLFIFVIIKFAYNELLLDGGNHGAAAELLHVVEHVVNTALVVHHQLIRIHTELVDHDIVHGLRTVLGKHEVVRRGSRLLVGVTADEVLRVRGALDEVGHRVDVDELLLGDVPAVDIRSYLSMKFL